MPPPLRENKLRFERLEFVFNSSSAFSSAFAGIWSLRNADAPVGEGQIASGAASGLHELFRSLGWDVTFSYSPSRSV